jgi:hypothetical protein
MSLCGYHVILDRNEYLIKSTMKILINKFDTKDLGVIDIKNY